MTDHRPKRRPDLEVRLEDQEALVSDPETGVTHLLNASAFAIFELCDGSTTIASMAEALAAVTSLEMGEAHRQVTSTVALFEEKALLE